MPEFKTPEQYGLQLPTGSSFIRNGDDAIANNARKTPDIVLDLLAGVKLSPTDNLNQIIKPGFYFAEANAIVQKALNYPVDASAGALHVKAYQSPGRDSVFQTYYSYLHGGRVFTRRVYRSEWTPWQENAWVSTVESAVSSSKKSIESGIAANLAELRPQLLLAAQEADSRLASNLEAEILASYQMALEDAKSYTDTAFSASGPGGATDTQIDAAVSRAIAGGRVASPALLPASGKKAVGVDELFFNVRDYGATGDGVTNDTAAILAAHTAALRKSADATLYFPAGNYVVDPLNIRTGIDAKQATITTSAAGVALTVGAPGVVTSRKSFWLPRVIHKINVAAGKWEVADTTGVRLLNLNSCNVWFDFIQGFTEGLVMEGCGQGFAYTTVYAGTVWTCRRSMILRARKYLGAGGYANQNLILNGRVQIGWSEKDDPQNHSVMLQPDLDGSFSPNNNTFVNTSFEGPQIQLYRAYISGHHNRFINCRWEHHADETVRVRFADDSGSNLIDSGYMSRQIVPSYGERTGRNRIVSTDSEWIGFSDNAKPVTIPTGTPTQIGWASPIHLGCPYDDALNHFVPTQGSWRITAALNVIVNAPSGYVDVRIRTSDGKLLSSARITPARAGAHNVRLEARAVFNGLVGVFVQVEHTTGVDASLITTNTYSAIRLERLA